MSDIQTNLSLTLLLSKKNLISVKCTEFHQTWLCVLPEIIVIAISTAMMSYEAQL